MFTKVLSLLFALLLSLTFRTAGTDAPVREDKPFLSVAEEDLLPGEAGYAFPGLKWGCSPEEAAEALGIDLGAPEESEFPELGFTRRTYSEPAARLSFFGLTSTRLDFEFRDGGLWCVDATWAPHEDVSGEFARVCAELTGILGEADQSASREGRFCGQTRRWIADYAEGLVSVFALQMDGRDGEYTVLHVGWMLADPERLISD